MWRVMFVLLVLGMLSGCESKNHNKGEGDAPSVRAVLAHYGGPGWNDLYRVCLDGYEFALTRDVESVSIAQFWEVGSNGQPRPRMCGGE